MMEGGGALMRRVNPPCVCGGGGRKGALCASEAPLQFREGHLGPRRVDIWRGGIKIDENRVCVCVCRVG